MENTQRDDVVDQLKNALAEARAKLQEQQEFIESVQGLPRNFAVCLRTGKVGNKPSALIVMDQKVMETEVAKELVPRVRPGRTLVVAGPGAIVDVAEDFQSIGTVSTVSKIVEPGLAEIHMESGTRLAFYCAETYPKIEGGNRVILDPAGMVIVADLGRPKEQFAFTKDTGVSWDDIGGLNEQKVLMKEAIELPLLHPGLFKAYGKKPIKGVLLAGSAGNGKTMLAKAAATSIAKAHGNENGSGFIYIKGPEVLSKWVGQAEATIRAIFRQARDYKKDHGHAALVFIDEAEAILSMRGSGISSDMEKTIVPQFLSEMDGLEESGAMVLLATNRADRLDPAVVRDGRIDRTIAVPRPNEHTAAKIFAIHLKDKPFKESIATLAEFCAEEAFSRKRVLYQIDRKSGKDTIFTLASIINGAMCAGIVDRATSIALKRDVDSSARKASGMTKADIVEAIDGLMKSQQSLDHSQELSELVSEFRDDIRNIRRVGMEAA